MPLALLISLLLCGPALAADPQQATEQEPGQEEECPHPQGRKPTPGELRLILRAHQEWVVESSKSDWAVPGAWSDPRRANLCNANLNGANLSGAFLHLAVLSGASMRGANLSGAYLVYADLSDADLSDADLSDANLTDARLLKSKLTNAQLAGADLTHALYAPASSPPAPYLVGIKGLKNADFFVLEVHGAQEVILGSETGLVQLRELLHDAGLRELEREATFAIELGRTGHAIVEWRKNPATAAEGFFRHVAFYWTTAYGLHPGRALLLIIVLWVLLTPLYFWPITRSRSVPDLRGAIYRVWSKERIIEREGQAKAAGEDTVERLHARGLAAIGYAAHFSLMSAFNIGFREFNVGTWIARIQANKYTLEPTGWVRVVSGIQSLLSVYLLAIWALTYFGRPFE
ncbi:pentapeptide repeat-containing protein [Archangium lansingense]|uniref:pentapeptide repeat-containing protein n=1 Tax=Archangium lansingense TaxID=2995310 RepID=UPI003B7B212F